MASYFSMKWASVLSRSTFVEHTTGSDHSGNEDNVLDTFKQSSKPMIEDAVQRLADEDPFRCLVVEHSTLRDDILLRVLRFNELNVDKAMRHLETTLNWRAQSRICSVDFAICEGRSSGLPLARISETTEKGDTLFFAAAGLYDRTSVERAVQKVGVARMFERMLYDSTGPRARRGTVVVDFTGFGTKNIDIHGLRVGMMIYMSHYPEVFDKVFLANYPRLLYGVWKAIVPLLDKRTACRVVWVEANEQLKEALMERFSEKQIPTWLGGKAEGSQMRLLNGMKVSSDALAERFV